MAGQLNGCVEVARSFRYRFAAHGGQELVAGLLQLPAPSAGRKSCDPEEYFAPHNRAGNYAITLLQPGHPILDSWGCPHQITDGVCVQKGKSPWWHSVEGALIAHRQPCSGNRGIEIVDRRNAWMR